MEVTATYGMNGHVVTTAPVTGYTIIPTPLVDGIDEVTISYSELGSVVTTTQAVSITHRVKAIDVTTPPAKTVYEYLDTLDTDGIVVTATYSDGTTAPVTDISYDVTTLGTVTDSQVVNITYVENDVTVTTSFNVQVNRKVVELTLNPATVVVGSDTWENGVEVKIITDFDGTLYLDKTSALSGAITVEWGTDNRTLYVKGDGETTVDEDNAQTFTISAKDDGKCYIAAGDVSFDAMVEYWTFGAGTGEVADEAWFAGLKTYLATHSGSSIKTTSGGSIVGATKTVTLSSAVLGTTTHLIRVIGVDQDADNTVTWQTKNCLANTAVFGSSSALWIGSTARALCQSYYNYFPGKASIKTVSKGTATAQNGNTNNAATYNDETVWLPSESEMGLNNYSSLTYSNSTTSNAECTAGKKFQYSYYTSNSNRIKYYGDSSTSVAWYWERSRYYSGSDRVCLVNADGSADRSAYNHLSLIHI